MDESIKLVNKMAFSFKNTKKDIDMIEEDEQHYRNTKSCNFCEKELSFFDKVRDHCHLTGKYKGSAHNKGNIIVTQKQNIFILNKIRNLSVYDCHLFFKKLEEKTNNKVKHDIIPRTYEEYI